MTKDGLIKRLLRPSYKVKVKRYLTTRDLAENYRMLGKAEKIINNYGKSLVLNEGNVVFRMSTLLNTKKEIEIAIKTFLEVNYDLGENDLNNLIDAFGSLALFIDNAKSDHINLEYRRSGETKNYDETYNKIITQIQKLNMEKLARMTYLREYAEVLKDSNL